MLPKINLDKERYNDLADSAIKSIYKYAPQWSDYNAHDPGITLIELLSFMTEAQQYHLNQLSTEMRIAYLSILGQSLHKKKSSSALVMVNPKEGKMTFPNATRLKAFDITFETDEKVTCLKRTLIDGFSKIDGNIISFKNQIEVDSSRMNLEVFGKRPCGGESLYLCFDTAFEKNKSENIYVDIFNDYSVKRNEMSKDFVPLAKIKWEYLTENGFKTMDEVIDETHDFLYDGKISFKLSAEMHESNLEGHSLGYWIKATVEQSFYDISPILSCINVNGVRVFQRKTLSIYEDFDVSIQKLKTLKINHALAFNGKIEVYYNVGNKWIETNDFKIKQDFNEMSVDIQLGKELLKNKEVKAYRIICFDDEFTLDRHLADGDGFPYQQYALDIKDIMAENLCVMAENEQGYYEDFVRVDSFTKSTPEDLHFMYSEEKSTIYFGDCEKGYAPEGKIKIISAKESKGQLGNITEKQINVFEDFFGEVDVINHKGSLGGRDAESIDECFLRFKRSQHKVERAVTNYDYEYLVRNTGGLMIKNCKVLPAERVLKNDGSVNENSISIVVEPFSSNEKRRLSIPYIKTIMNNLDDKKLIGTNINILSPEYIGIVIISEIEVKANYRDAEEIIENAICKFFKEEMSGFGKTVYYNMIYGIIDSLDCVSAINSLVIDAQGKNIRRTINGDIKLMPNAVTYLSTNEIILISERE